MLYTMNAYTLITGATGGLGRAFCFACAARGESLCLTAPSEEKLIGLKEELLAKYPDREISLFPCDLTKKISREMLFSALEGYAFSRFVSVAGADIQKSFLAYSQEKLVFQIRLNLEAGISLTRFVLDHRASDLSLIAISSVSGIYPMPYFAIYSATKTALTSFYTALHEELKGQANVTVVLPGAMPTRPDVVQNIKTQGLWGKLAVKSPAWVAERSLKQSARNKRVYIPGFWNNVMHVCTKPIPLSVKLKFIAKRWSKTVKDAFSV